MAEVMTIPEALARAKAEGLPVSEYSLRRWIKTGAIPSRNAGRKALVYYPSLIRFLTCEDGGDVRPADPGRVPLRVVGNKAGW